MQKEGKRIKRRIGRERECVCAFPPGDATFSIICFSFFEHHTNTNTNPRRETKETYQNTPEIQGAEGLVKVK
jgi:hypothetical protein